MDQNDKSGLSLGAKISLYIFQNFSNVVQCNTVFVSGKGNVILNTQKLLPLKEVYSTPSIYYGKIFVE